jgi:hypothetical protein
VSKVLKVFVYQNMGIINTNVREILSAKIIFFSRCGLLASLHDEVREQTVVGNLTGLGRQNHAQIYCQDTTWITVYLDKIRRHNFVGRVTKTLLL